LIGDLASDALGLARVFTGGGRLVVAAPGRHDHAQHVAVEFIHPAVVGARSLPAVAAHLEDLPHLVTPDDALLVLLPTEHSPVGFEQELPEAALVLTTDPAATEPELVRWYHVLWELVQVGLEHPGLTGGNAVSGGDSTNFLYPFLDAAETSEADLLASMRESATGKASESTNVSHAAVSQNDAELGNVARAIDACRQRGNTVHTIGNGGSSSDAARLARLLRAEQVRANCLATDPAVLTALANDLGVDRIFARQVEAAVRPGDVLVIFSTSGASPNLLAALDVDVVTNATTVTSAGYGGGPLAEHPAVDHRLTIDSSSVHRIQEAQGVLMDQLCARLRTEVEVGR
jgi:D-sedoheptulose 7-phosphate isomerase